MHFENTRDKLCWFLFPPVHGLHFFQLYQASLYPSLSSYFKLSRVQTKQKIFLELVCVAAESEGTEKFLSFTELWIFSFCLSCLKDLQAANKDPNTSSGWVAGSGKAHPAF